MRRMSANSNREDTKQTISSQLSDTMISTGSTCGAVTQPSPALPVRSPPPITLNSNLITAPTQSENALINQQQYVTPRNGSARRGLVHSVSIIVEPAMADGDGDDSFVGDTVPIASVSTERRNTIAGPIVLLEDFGFEPPRKAREEDDIVQSIIAHARLRKEEFARLLEEHAQIVNEINRAETSLL